MILRKPYAFLIKNFRIIHLIITFLLVYVAFKTSAILNYLNDLTTEEASKYSAINYVSFTPIISIILAIIVLLIVYLLMRYKKKPSLIYLLSIIGYIGLIVVLFISFFYFESLQHDLLIQKTLRVYRDLFFMYMGFQYIIIGIMLTRGIGFNIKKFNFAKDLQELNISTEDNEEVEIDVGLDTNKVTRSFRRKRREFIYYIKENKLFVIVSLTVILFITGLYFFLSANVFNKVYTKGEKIKTSNYVFEIDNSYVTTKKYNNTKIDNGYSYVIVQINISSLIEEKQTLDLDDFVLNIGRKKYVPNKKTYEYFIDLGEGYTSQNIKYNEPEDYIIVYKIDHKYHKKKMQISYEYSTSKYSEIRFINLENINLDKVSSTKNYKIGDTINFKNSILQESTFKVEKVEFGDTFDYTYKYCVKEDSCSDISKKITKTDDESITILKMDVDSNYDEDTMVDNVSLINFYGAIKYELNGKTYISKLNNRTLNTTNEYIFLEVDKNILSSTNAWLELEVKNIKYKYKIKGN